jgi:predicted aspartyl protease
MGMTHVKCIVFNLINPSQQAEIEFLVDSGAIYTVIPHSERIFTLADGRQITWPVGNAGFTIGSRQGASVVVFGPGDTPSLLGVATLEELGLGIDPVRRELTQIPLPLFSAAPLNLNTT